MRAWPMRALALAAALALTGWAAWATRAAPGDQTLNVTGSEYVYAPNELFVRPAERLTVQFANVGQAPHNIVFELDNGRVERTAVLQSGQQASLAFDSPAALGRYAYYCSVGSHRQLGMEGQLVVESAEPPTPVPTAAPWALVLPTSS